MAGMIWMGGRQCTIILSKSRTNRQHKKQEFHTWRSAIGVGESLATTVVGWRLVFTLQ